TWPFFSQPRKGRFRHHKPWGDRPLIKGKGWTGSQAPGQRPGHKGPQATSAILSKVDRVAAMLLLWRVSRTSVLGGRLVSSRASLYSSKAFLSPLTASFNMARSLLAEKKAFTSIQPRCIFPEAVPSLSESGR